MRDVSEDLKERAAIMQYDGGMARATAEHYAFNDITGGDMTYPIDTVLFCVTETDETAIDAAKAYIKEHGLTSSDVRLVRTDGTVQVIAKREIG